MQSDHAESKKDDRKLVVIAVGDGNTYGMGDGNGQCIPVKR